MREHTQHQVRTAFDAARGAILARNAFDPQFAGWSAFRRSREPVTSHTGDRREFLGRNGAADEPGGARHRRCALRARPAPGIDPCAALQCALDLAPGETREIVILLGAAPRTRRRRGRRSPSYRRRGARAAALDRARPPRGASGSRSSRSARRSPPFDAMLNRWTLYQALSCRMWARSALYQSSGAYGFRDQLQDVMAFVYAEPALAREHILRAAGRQFVEGDVQHWWHPQSGRGVRTRFSDDLAWLPYVVDHYVRVTGDATVLDEYGAVPRDARARAGRARGLRPARR